MLAHLNRIAAELGLPFAKREKTYNSRLAQELSKYSESQVKGDEFHNAVFRAYFAEGLNIGDIAVLIEVGKTAGLSENMTRRVLETGAFKEAVDADWTRSRELGVTAVPTFMINHQVLVGAQPYHVLVQFMESNNVFKRNTAE